MIGLGSLLVLLIIAVVIVIVLFMAIDYFARSGGDARLWMALKGLVVLAALVIVLQRAGVL